MAGYVLTYYTAAAVSYVLNDNTNRFLLGMRGFGYPKAELPMQRAPYTNGAMLLGTIATIPYLDMQPRPVPYVGPREMEVAIGIKAASLNAWQTAYRALVLALSPNRAIVASYPHKLSILLPDASTVRDISCFCTAISDPEMDGPLYGQVIVTFLAPEPFFHVPWVGSSWATATNPKTFTNSGDVPFWPTIAIYGDAAAPVVGIHITNNTTGKVWSSNHNIATGVTNSTDVYMGQAAIGRYEVDVWKEDLISTMDTDAEFWPLELGDNALQWSSTSGTPSVITVWNAWQFLAI